MLKRKSYNKAWQNLSLIEFFSERGINDFFPMIEKYNKYGEQRNIALDSLRQIWDQFLSPKFLNSDDIRVKYLKDLTSIISNWAKFPTKERVNPFQTQRSLILPIRILNRKFIKLNPIIFNFVTPFNNKAMEVSHHYLDMELLLRHTKYQYEEYYFSIRMIKKTNKLIIKILG